MTETLLFRILDLDHPKFFWDLAFGIWCLPLPIFSRPIIRNLFSMRWQPVLIGRTINIGLRWNVDDDCLFLADAFPSMIDPFGHLNQQRIVNPYEKFIQFLFCRR